MGRDRPAPRRSRRVRRVSLSASRGRVPRTRREPGRAPDVVGVLDQLCEPASRLREPLGAEVATHEREGERSLVAREGDVERLDTEGAALALVCSTTRTASRTPSP